jgi:hypothetical protein
VWKFAIHTVGIMLNSGVLGRISEKSNRRTTEVRNAEIHREIISADEPVTTLIIRALHNVEEI